MKKILLILLFFIPFISPPPAQAELKDCAVTISPDPVTTNTIAIDVTIKPKREGDLVENKNYLIKIDDYWVGQSAGALDPNNPAAADKFTYTSASGIVIKGLSPQGYPNTRFVAGVNTATFAAKSDSRPYVISVFTDNGNTQVCQDRGFTPTVVARADQCTIELSRVPFNATPAPTPLSCQQQCERVYGQDSNIDAAAACLRGCQTATPTPKPSSITSDADIYLKANNLAHQNIFESNLGQERFRLVIKRDNDQGTAIPEISNQPRSYTELTSGDLNIGKLEQGAYVAEVKNFAAVITATERNFCFPLRFRVGYPGEEGGIESTFAPRNFLQPFCRKTNENEQKFICDTAIGEIEANMPALVKKLFAVLLSLSGGVAVLLIIMAGYQLITSSGNPEKTQAAKERLTSAIVGLIFIIFSFVILEVIGVSILKIPGIG